jgi:mannose-1-phosphate guanylyltransferase
MRTAPDAIVLCGGAGSRLRTMTDDPKAMVSVAGRPFLELLLRQLHRWGIERVILAVGYRSEAIQSHFSDEAFGLQLLYSKEVFPLGTGGALRNAADLVESSVALVLNGDSYTDADLRRFLADHHDSGADMSVLIVPPDGRDDCGTVSIDIEGRLLAFQEKQAQIGPKYINAGIYLVSRYMLQEIAAGSEISLERELIPQWLAQGKRIRATVDPAACHDIGTPERYRTAQATLAEAETCYSPTSLGEGR